MAALEFGAIPERSEPAATSDAEEPAAVALMPPACPYCRRHSWMQTWRITGGKGCTWIKPTGVTVEPFFTRDAVREWECCGCHTTATASVGARLAQIEAAAASTAGR